MKLTAFLLIIVFMQVSAKTYSQVTLNAKNAHLADVLESIKKQTGYVFLYDGNLLDNTNVSIKVTNATISTALNECFKNLPLTYKIVKQNVVIQKMEPSLSEKLNTILTIPITVTGIIVGGDDNKPIVGASIKIKGTSNGAITNENGSFNVTANINDVISIAYIGYDPIEVMIKGTSIGRIILTPSKTGLNEVVVTGYTSQRKKDITGAVAIVDIANMKSVPAGNTSTLLQGQASGVTVTNSGNPGVGRLSYSWDRFYFQYCTFDNDRRSLRQS